MRILVLLSTWNGAKYVGEQLASILAQEFDGSLKVLVRDDGSCDHTLEIIESIGDSRVEVIHGENLGTKASFFELIHNAMRYDPDYFALADQDDVWLPSKIRRATERLAVTRTPALYCSALSKVDEQLRPLNTYTFTDTIGFESAFLANCASGCTTVFNRELLLLLEPQPDTQKILMHDWWLYLVAATFGEVVYDCESHIYYRQHDSNQLGMHTGIANLLQRFYRFLARPATPSRLSQAREFQRLYAHRLPSMRARYLSALVACERHLLTRLHFAFNQRPRRSEISEEIFALATFLVGRY